MPGARHTYEAREVKKHATLAARVKQWNTGRVGDEQRSVFHDGGWTREVKNNRD